VSQRERLKQHSLDWGRGVAGFLEEVSEELLSNHRSDAQSLRTWVARSRLRGGGINDTGQSDELLRRKKATCIVGAHSSQRYQRGNSKKDRC
jgi:hypothetical protein